MSIQLTTDAGVPVNADLQRRFFTPATLADEDFVAHMKACPACGRPMSSLRWKGAPDDGPDRLPEGFKRDAWPHRGIHVASELPCRLCRLATAIRERFPRSLGPVLVDPLAAQIKAMQPAPTPPPDIAVDGALFRLGPHLRSHDGASAAGVYVTPEAARRVGSTLAEYVGRPEAVVAAHGEQYILDVLLARHALGHWGVHGEWTGDSARRHTARGPLAPPDAENSLSILNGVGSVRSRYRLATAPEIEHVRFGDRDVARPKANTGGMPVFIHIHTELSVGSALSLVFSEGDGVSIR